MTNEIAMRTVEVNTHKPGALGALVGKRVYVYSDAADSSPNSSNDYTYTYDALGNVQVVYKASGTVGQEAYFFTQDAFGNELSGDANIPASNRTNLLGGAMWASARTAGITEHQTGKIQSAFSGLYYFHARWYDPVVGRFLGKCEYDSGIESKYLYCEANPVNSWDVDGTMPIPPKSIPPGFGEPVKAQRCFRRARIQGKLANMQDACGCHPHVYLRVDFSSGDSMRWGRGRKTTGYEDLEADEVEICTPVPHKVGCVLKAILEMLGGNPFGEVENVVPYRAFYDPTSNCTLFPRQILNRCEQVTCYPSGMGPVCFITYPDQPFPQFVTW